MVLEYLSTLGVTCCSKNRSKLLPNSGLLNLLTIAIVAYLFSNWRTNPMAQNKTQNLFTEITTQESSTVNGGCYYGYRSYGYRRASYGHGYYRPRYYRYGRYYHPRYYSASYWTVSTKIGQ
jgi:hypothetical protein